ncbi:hypothetical protein [Nocardia sp. N2S4-5]|uniref:hypothetical protein n=1 Tax=Nocardia sp. N2S4-5 TaxID=3351565 RepID=UPI0037D584E7
MASVSWSDAIFTLGDFMLTLVFRLGCMVTVAALATAALSTSAEADAIVPVGVAKSCDLGFTFSQPTVLAPLILGDAWADCAAPPASHRMELSLARRDTNGMWITMATITDRRIPAPRLNYQVSAECSPGLWRITAHVTGSASECPRG